MYYIIKNLEWSKSRGHELYCSDEFVGAVDIINAKIYSEEELNFSYCKKRIQSELIKPIPITKEIGEIIKQKIIEHANRKIEAFEKFIN